MASDGYVPFHNSRGFSRITLSVEALINDQDHEHCLGVFYLPPVPPVTSFVQLQSRELQSLGNCLIQILWVSDEGDETQDKSWGPGLLSTHSMLRPLPRTFGGISFRQLLAFST